MSKQSRRLPEGGRIDRSKPLRFTFNGRSLTGFEGDTLASALLANDVAMTARSFRYHRPRGVLSAGVEEPHAIVSVGSGANKTPNVRATRQRLYEGLEAKSQSGWPSLACDLSGLTGWATQFLPVGFYYKTFIWPSWDFYEGMIRRFAGSAPTPDGPDTDIYDKRHAHCDILIIGGGPAGLAAARSAAQTGARILLIDDQPEPGGALLWRQAEIDGLNGDVWARKTADWLRRQPNVTVLTSTTAAAAWDDNYFLAVEMAPHEGGVAQRLWKIRCRRAILATGAAERPMVFPDNDRPGIMLADSVRRYAHQYAVLPGMRALFYANNDSAYAAAFALQEKGLAIEAIVDTRKEPGDVAEAARKRNIKIYAGGEIIATSGRRRVTGAVIRQYANEQSGPFKLNFDLLVMSGGWSPVVHLFSQKGGKLRYDETHACFRPEQAASSMTIIGSANGEVDLSASLEAAHRGGGASPSSDDISFAPAPRAENADPPYRIEPHWRTGAPTQGRQWIDFYHDVTTQSIDVAATEGYVSVEHLKRYTTTGMAPDQGKTSNINALANLAAHLDRSIPEVGTTTFRPPYTPVTLGALAGRETGPRAWPVRRLPLHDWHVGANGVMENHSGWLRAACYPRNGETEDQAIHRETVAARNAVTLFDSSSLGKIEVKGPDAGRFLNRIYVNNVLTLKTGRVRYGMMLNENGVIFDDGVFARLGEDHYLVCASSAGAAGVFLAFEEWLQVEWPELDVAIYNATTQWATLTLSGPKSRNVLSAVIQDQDLSPDAFSHMAVREGSVGGAPYRLMRVSFTGELSYELSIPAGYAEDAWLALRDAGEAFGLAPLGIEALDILRLEKGYLEVGVDTDVSTSPLDMGWRNAIAKKKTDFVGKRSLSRPDNLRPNRLQLVGVLPEHPDAHIPVGAHFITPSTGEPEGHVTSSCVSPTLGRAIAMGLLRAGEQRLGETVTIDVNGQALPARIVPACFYDPENERLQH